MQRRIYGTESIFRKCLFLYLLYKEKERCSSKCSRGETHSVLYSESKFKSHLGHVIAYLFCFLYRTLKVYRVHNIMKAQDT